MAWTDEAREAAARVRRMHSGAMKRFHAQPFVSYKPDVRRNMADTIRAMRKGMTFDMTVKGQTQYLQHAVTSTHLRNLAKQRKLLNIKRHRR